MQPSKTPHLFEKYQQVIAGIETRAIVGIEIVKNFEMITSVIDFASGAVRFCLDSKIVLDDRKVGILHKQFVREGPEGKVKYHVSNTSGVNDFLSVVLPEHDSYQTDLGVDISTRFMYVEGTQSDSATLADDERIDNTQLLLLRVGESGKQVSSADSIGGSIQFAIVKDPMGTVDFYRAKPKVDADVVLNELQSVDNTEPSGFRVDSRIVQPGNDKVNYVFSKLDSSDPGDYELIVELREELAKAAEMTNSSKADQQNG